MALRCETAHERTLHTATSEIRSLHIKVEAVNPEKSLTRIIRHLRRDMGFCMQGVKDETRCVTLKQTPDGADLAINCSGK
jgi:hypothetical protein